eukprot:s1106_g22.t1
MALSCVAGYVPIRTAGQCSAYSIANEAMRVADLAAACAFAIAPPKANEVGAAEGDADATKPWSARNAVRETVSEAHRPPNETIVHRHPAPSQLATWLLSNLRTGSAGQNDAKSDAPGGALASCGNLRSPPVTAEAAAWSALSWSALAP